MVSAKDISDYNYEAPQRHNIRIMTVLSPYHTRGEVLIFCQRASQSRRMCHACQRAAHTQGHDGRVWRRKNGRKAITGVLPGGEGTNSRSPNEGAEQKGHEGGNTVTSYCLNIKFSRREASKTHSFKMFTFYFKNNLINTALKLFTCHK